MIIEVVIFDKNNESRRDSLESKVYSKCGDAGIMTFWNRHIDLVLKFVYIVQIMIPSNAYLKKRLGNSTKGIGVSIQ